MAEGAVIGALRVVIGADTATLEQNLNKAQASFGAFAKNVTTIASGIGLEKAFEKVAEIAVEAFNKIADGFERIDKIAKSAAKSGLAVEEFSSLNVAATLADVSMETLTKTLGTLSKNIADTGKGVGDARATFEALGITVRDSDGNLKSVSTVLGEVADQFEKTGNSVLKPAQAMVLFGKAGKELIPLLNDGSHGLKEAADTAEKLGLVIDKQTAAQVQKFNDDLKVLKLAGDGFVNLLIQQLVPAFEKWSGAMVETAKQGDLQRIWVEKTVGIFKELVVIVYQAIVADQLLGMAFGELIKVFSNFPDIEASREAFANLKELMTALPDALGKARDEVMRLFITVAGGKKAVQDANEEQSQFQQTLNKLIVQAKEASGVFNQLAPGFAAQAVQLKLTDDQAKSLSTTVAGLTKQQQQLNQAQAALVGAQMIQSQLYPYEQLEQTLTRINALYVSGGISADQAAQMAKRAADSSAASWQAASVDITQNLAAGFKAFAAQNKAFAGAAKAAAIANAIANTYVAATKALSTFPPPLSYAAAAAAVVAGMGMVAQISSQQFATGGSFKVGGGMTGVDSQMVAFRATPGEMVDIRRPGQQSATAGGVQTINLALPRPDDFFATHVRQMVEALNAAAPDGYVVKVAA